MPSFADSIFLFILALLLFGPKKLPVLARELGKWMGEFRRASNEFKMQMEDELRVSEQADRQKQIAAMEAAAPIPPPLNEPTEPEHPHLRHNTPDLAPEPSPLTPEPSLIAPEPSTLTSAASAEAPQTPHPERSQAEPRDPRRAPGEGQRHEPVSDKPASDASAPSSPAASPPAKVGSHDTSTADGVRPIPIATSGSLHMMPPATGLPTPRTTRTNALSGLVDSIPEAQVSTTSNTSSHPAAADGEAADAQRHHPPTRSAAPESLAHGD